MPAGIARCGLNGSMAVVVHRKVGLVDGYERMNVRSQTTVVVRVIVAGVFVDVQRCGGRERRNQGLSQHHSEEAAHRDSLLRPRRPRVGARTRLNMNLGGHTLCPSTGRGRLKARPAASGDAWPHMRSAMTKSTVTRRVVTSGVTSTLVVLMAAALAAQKTTEVHKGKGGSPHVKTAWTVDGANISIEYGRPYLKGRTVGKDVAPFGKEWRVGADEATTLVTDRPLTFGDLKVPAGTYTLYAVPGESGWQLVVSKKTGQWGVPYPAGEDLGRTPMSVAKTTAPVEQLTFSIDDTPAGGTLRIEWGTTSASARFTVG